MSDIKRRKRRKRFNPRVAALLALLILFAGLEVILYATLQPFQFNFHHLSAHDYANDFVLPPTSVLDFPRNVILFMPLGFGLAAFLRYFKVPYTINFALVVTFGFLVTLMVESLQIFLSGRTPSISDLAANTLGAAAGFICFRLWRRRKVIVYRLSYILNIRPPTVVALGIFLLIVVVISYLYSAG
jgi:VanZ family protein